MGTHNPNSYSVFFDRKWHRSFPRKDAAVIYLLTLRRETGRKIGYIFDERRKVKRSV